MGVHYKRDYWHYSDAHTYPPFAFRTQVEIDNRAGWYMGIYTVLYHESLESKTHTHFTRMWEGERINSFAARVWKGAREWGAGLSEKEYDRFIEHLLDVIGDQRRPTSKEIIND